MAALNVLVERGPTGIAVERLAEDLGTTKGSFYWHFANRAECVAAALELWEQIATTNVIDSLATLPTPAERLAALINNALSNTPGGLAEAALVAHAADPQVAEVLERVTSRRLRYTQNLLEELGLPTAEATKKALAIYASYLGFYQIAKCSPASLSATPGTHISHLASELIPDFPASEAS